MMRFHQGHIDIRRQSDGVWWVQGARGAAHSFAPTLFSWLQKGQLKTLSSFGATFFGCTRGTAEKAGFFAFTDGSNEA